MKDHELWKNIGLQSEASPSLQTRGAHPQLRKGYDLSFDDLGSESDNQPRQLFKIKRVSSPVYSEGTNKSQQNRSPMIITMEMEDRREEQEHVLQAISFESQPINNENSINKLLDNFQLEPNGRAISEIQNCLAQRQNQRLLQKVHKNTNIINNLSKVRADVAQLKQELLGYKTYLLEVLSMWQVNAIKDCKKISNSIDSRVTELVDSREKTKEKGVRETRELRHHNSDLHNLIVNLREQLANEKIKNHMIQKDKEELQATLFKKISQIETVRIQALEDKHRDGNHIQQQLSRTQKQLDDIKLQAEETSRQLTRLKDTIKDKEHRLEIQNQENNHSLKQITDLRRQLQDGIARERKAQMKSQLQLEQHQQEIVHYQKENIKHKQQIYKFRELLKGSEQQLRTCQTFISNLNRNFKEQEQSIESLTAKMNEEKMQYYKKLQNFDKLLMDIQRSFQEVSKNQEQKVEQFKNRQIDLQNLRQRLENREVELREKQFEIEQLRNDLKREIFMLERKQQGMKAQYKMALHAQNATKDKWYQRYYQLFSDRQDRSKFSSSPSLTRETLTHNYSSRPSYKKIPIFERPVRDRCSPHKNGLIKAKSQFNLGIGSPKRADIGRKKTEIQIPQNYRDITITSRINNLRNQLSKELNNMNSR